MDSIAEIFFGIVLIAVLVIVGIFGLGFLNDTAANKSAARAHEVYSRYQGEAGVIRAGGQARLDSAAASSERAQANAAAFSERTLSASQAFTFGLSTVTNNVVMMIVTMGTIGIIVLAIFFLAQQRGTGKLRRQLPPPTQTILVLPMMVGGSRRQAYQQLSDALHSQYPQLTAPQEDA